MAEEAINLKRQPATAEPIFVFGSSLSGQHTAETAAIAAQFFGAKAGQSSGATGAAYAIPYRSSAGALLTPQVIANYIDSFLRHAEEAPDTRFQIARFACERGAHSDAVMAHLFAHMPGNVTLPGVWSALLDPLQPARLLIVDQGGHLKDPVWQTRLERYLALNSPLWNVRAVELVSIGGNARTVVANDSAAKHLGLKHRVIGPNEQVHGRDAQVVAEVKAICYATHYLGISDFEQTAQPQQIRTLNAATRAGLLVDQIDSSEPDS